jgi:hypothetical protein
VLATEPAPTATVRTLTGGRPVGGDELTAVAERLPPEGLAAPRTRGRYRLLAQTYRLLDSRILAAALSCLDQDLGQPIAEHLSTFRELRLAAEETQQDPEHETLVTLAAGHRLATTQTTEVRLSVDGADVAVVPFRLELSMTLGHTSAVVRRGSIRYLECVVTEVAVVLSIAEPPVVLSRWTSPLKSLRLPLERPVTIPILPGVPAPRSG